MQPDFYSRIGSVTKTFTVTAILQLVDQGKLELDDPISRYIAGVPSGDRITLRELAQMRSGLVTFGHSGSIFGYQTVALYLPQKQTTLVFFINTDVPHEASTTLARAITSVISPDHVYR